MEQFKLNDKEYSIEIKNNDEYVITALDDKETLFIADSEEIKGLAVDYKKIYAFSDKGIVDDIIKEVKISAVNDTYVILDIRKKNVATSPPAKVLLKDFFKDALIELATGKEEPDVSDQMQSIGNALSAWRLNSDVCFLDQNCGIVDELGDIVGVGYFENDKLIAISKCNLSMFEKLSIVMPKQSVAIELVHDQQLGDDLASYFIKQKSFNLVTISQSQKDAIASLELTHTHMHQKICQMFKFKEIGKAKSHLDNFFDI